MIRTSIQNKQLYLLLGQLNINSELKSDMVYTHSNGRVTSSSKMTVSECQSLINYLSSASSDTEEQKSCNVMRRKIIANLRKCGYTTGTKADMKRINDWCIKYGYLFKPINDYTVKELPILVTQASAVYQSFQKSMNK